MAFWSLKPALRAFRGYEREIRQNFFGADPGLPRRFPERIELGTLPRHRRRLATPAKALGGKCSIARSINLKSLRT